MARKKGWFVATPRTRYSASARCNRRMTVSKSRPRHVIFSINGSAVPGGNTNGNVSRVVNFAFTDLATQNAVNSARFSSSQNAFEVDNVAVQAVPEPTTWLLMILGMLGIGFTMRRSNKESTSRIRFA